jgi:hypothetical protein
MTDVVVNSKERKLLTAIKKLLKTIDWSRWNLDKKYMREKQDEMRRLLE